MISGRRRALVLAAMAGPLAGPARAAVDYPRVVARALVFPRDHGAHPEYRIEWWYLTGWLEDIASGSPLGLQVTFFRTRTPIDPANPSRFAAHQLLFAHAAIADPARASLLFDERIARTGFGVVRASPVDTDIRLDRWSFVRHADGHYECAVAARTFQLRFTAAPTQPLLLQGQDGLSRKGPDPAQASYYYSQPHLQAEATLLREGRERRARGVAWLDHEWSSTLLDRDAAGWDWLGMNLDDGAALTAFRIRRKASNAPLYSYASLRRVDDGAVRPFAPQDVRFEPLEFWVSPRTRGRYPIAQRVTVGQSVFETRPLFADQELDTRLAGSAVYWEGASQLTEAGKPVGRGYLELTGYAAPLSL